MEEVKSTMDEQAAVEQVEQTESAEFGVETYVELCNWLKGLMRSLVWPRPLELNSLNKFSFRATTINLPNSTLLPELREWLQIERKSALQEAQRIDEEQMLDLSCVAAICLKLLDAIADERANTAVGRSEGDKTTADRRLESLKNSAEIFLRYSEEASRYDVE